MKYYRDRIKELLADWIGEGKRECSCLEQMIAQKADTGPMKSHF